MKSIFKKVRVNSSLPILDYVVYENGMFVSTNLEYQAEMFNPIAGFPVVQPTLFQRDWLALVHKAGKGKFVYADGKINGVDTPKHQFEYADFPRLSGKSAALRGTIEISARDLRGVQLAAAKKDIRYYLEGVLCDFGKGEAAGSNGHSLHLASNLISGGEGVAIVPNAAVDLILAESTPDDLISINLLAGELPRVKLFIHGKPAEIYSKTIDGEFPDYHKVIPTDYTGDARMVVGTQGGLADLKQYIALVKCSDKKIRYVGCKFSNNHLGGPANLATQNFTLSGVEGIGFTASHIADAMKFIDATTSTFLLSDENSSALICDGNRTAVVMPLRV